MCTICWLLPAACENPTALEIVDCCNMALKLVAELEVRPCNHAVRPPAAQAMWLTAKPHRQCGWCWAGQRQPQGDFLRHRGTGDVHD